MAEHLETGKEGEDKASDYLIEKDKPTSILII